MAKTSIFDSRSDEKEWINQIRKIVEEEVKVDIEVPVSIFRVPAALSALKPEAYVPQLLGLGPYHHFCPELYEMERYKLAAASRLQKMFRTLEFKELVDNLMEFEYTVRACYHKYLDLEGNTLMWIMAIDGLFLFEFLHIFMSKQATTETAHLLDSSGRKISPDGILSDIMMLENQIPFFLFCKIMSIQISSDDLNDSENLLSSILMNFSQAITPLNLKEDFPHKALDHAHLLDLLYHLIVPKLEEPQETSTGSPTNVNIAKKRTDSGNSHQVFVTLWNKLSNLNIRLPSKITKPIKNVMGIFGKVSASIPGLSSSASKNKENIKPENAVSSDGQNPVQVEKIMIPAASYLANVAGVVFCPSSGDISTIKFDEKEKKFYLPVITLDVHSEVIIRNLVAYEAMTVSKSLVFSRYTELMNGIMETADDAKLLREKKIIINKLKSDADVLQLFNGIGKSNMRLTHAPYFDKTIEDVNKFFNNSPRVRAYRCVKKYVYGSWIILTILATIVLFLLIGLQSFCSVYSCPRIFNITTVQG
ncbi:UPF0481 protein [Actinidia chinensis var. chinensis]|uniref:UPF0481 protein n=1 Tax=Actinidia chinensis var. chinensis TaxID=1590841 RepID=A0A2R6QS05_ACTCC|nr:UPF0481 protein [Actinidia chinensis var. chinensis]